MEKIVRSVQPSAKLYQSFYCLSVNLGKNQPTLFRTLCKHRSLRDLNIEWKRHTCSKTNSLKFAHKDNILHSSDRHTFSKSKDFKPCAVMVKQYVGSSMHHCRLQYSQTWITNSVRSLSTSASMLNNTQSAAVTSATTTPADIAGSSIMGSVPTDLINPDFIPISVAETAIMNLQHWTGLPWWGTIVLTAFLLRVVLMVPLTIHTFHNAARLQRLAPEVKDKAERLRKEVGMAMRQFGWDQQRAKAEYDKNFKRLLKELYVRDNCHPMKGTAAFWVQLPVWLSVSYALRNMSVRALNPDFDRHTECSSLMEGGMAWFPDLTCTDSTWLLPVLMGTVTLFNIEMNYLNVPEVNKYRKRLTFALRGVALVFIPISSAMPCAMVLYWVSSGVLAAVQNVVFEYSPFRRLVHLPQSPVESNSPAQALIHKAKLRYFKR